ncbi:hypothetical protein HUN08_10560 [Gordonia sp. X0973]|uniref:hypothetical protein n=1 Tax=Gordonia sp. X0973 TaxID=2742602 RepID=UPI00101BCD31|nr:hypothetical protein [Gordonia sp. X0973]QKT07585.1 hypothetical protein HUN08_10560 [Gordonia sp. X0973]
MRHRAEDTGELDAVPTGELSVIDAPGRRRRAGEAGRRRVGAGAPQRANRSRAAQRAVNRRAARLDREEKERKATVRTTAGASRPVGPGLVERVRELPFAVPVIALVALGLVGTLWLSTRAAQDSYELTVAKTQNQSLLDKRDGLKRTYESGDSAPELSDKAARLGLVPARNAARLVVGDDGRVTVRGKPAPATGRAPQSINPKSSDDPLRHIDKSKVEDSTGLPGDDAPQTSQPAAPAPQNGQAPDAAPATPDQAPPTPAAAPNVLPAPSAQHPATPRPAESNRGAPGSNPQRRS